MSQRGLLKRKFSSNEFQSQKTPIIPDLTNLMKEEQLNSNRNIGDCLNSFQIICEIGRGSYGTVFKVKSLSNDQIYVIKKINIKNMKERHQKEAVQEVQILRKISHPNIIKYYTSFMEDENLCIVMEYAQGGDLQHLIRKKRNQGKQFSEIELWKFAQEMGLALQYLHKKNIIHRDIKALNILLTKSKQIKIADLGVSKIMEKAGMFNVTRVGTPLYLSPELVKQQPYDHKIDIWALGCVLHHMAALEPPFYGDNLIALGFAIVNKPAKRIPDNYSDDLQNLIIKLLEKNANNRPEIQNLFEIYENKFDKLENKKIKEQDQIQIQQNIDFIKYNSPQQYQEHIQMRAIKSAQKFSLQNEKLNQVKSQGQFFDLKQKNQSNISMQMKKQRFKQILNDDDDYNFDVNLNNITNSYKVDISRISSQQQLQDSSKLSEIFVQKKEAFKNIKRDQVIIGNMESNQKDQNEIQIIDQKEIQIIDKKISKNQDNQIYINEFKNNSDKIQQTYDDEKNISKIKDIELKTQEKKYDVQQKINGEQKKQNNQKLHKNEEIKIYEQQRIDIINQFVVENVKIDEVNNNIQKNVKDHMKNEDNNDEDKQLKVFYNSQQNDKDNYNQIEKQNNQSEEKLIKQEISEYCIIDQQKSSPQKVSVRKKELQDIEGQQEHNDYQKKFESYKQIKYRPMSANILIQNNNNFQFQRQEKPKLINPQNYIKKLNEKYNINKNISSIKFKINHNVVIKENNQLIRPSTAQLYEKIKSKSSNDQITSSNQVVIFQLEKAQQDHKIFKIQKDNLLQHKNQSILNSNQLQNNSQQQENKRDYIQKKDDQRYLSSQKIIYDKNPNAAVEQFTKVRMKSANTLSSKSQIDLHKEKTKDFSDLFKNPNSEKQIDINMKITNRPQTAFKKKFTILDLID